MLTLVFCVSTVLKQAVLYSTADVFKNPADNITSNAWQSKQQYADENGLLKHLHY